MKLGLLLSLMLSSSAWAQEQDDPWGVGGGEAAGEDEAPTAEPAPTPLPRPDAAAPTPLPRPDDAAEDDAAEDDAADPAPAEPTPGPVPLPVPETAAPAVLTKPVDPEAAAIEAGAPMTPMGQITEVKVTGLRRLEEAAILQAVAMRSGEAVEAWKVRRDIRGVWETGFVDDVRVDVSPADSGPGVVVTFKVREKPAVREVRLKGNKKLDEDAINEVIDITPFSVLNQAEVARNVRRIREKYLEKGYYLVEVEPVVRDLGNDLVELTFDITENKKVIVQRIDIVGNENLADRKIKRFLQTRAGGILPWLTNSGTFIEENLDADAQIIRSVYLEEGYVNVQVEKPQAFLSPDKRSIYVTYTVKEGPRFKLGKIKIQGDFVAEEGLTEDAVQQVLDGDVASTVRERWDRAKKRAGDDALPPDTWDDHARRRPFEFNERTEGLDTGDWFKLSVFNQVRQEITDLYGDQGYAFANVTPLTDPDAEARVVDLTFDIQRGEKVRIGRIDISGNDPTFDKVVRREIPINEGEIYSGTSIKEARQRLERLGFFEEVKISTPRGAKSDELDMKVDVVEQPTGSFSVGAGFSNLENFVFTLNVSKNNFLGRGYIMSAAVNLSGSRQQGNLQLFDPYFLDSRWTLRVNAFSISRQFIEDEYQRGFSFAVGRYLDRRDDLRLELDYTYEDTGLVSIDAYKEKLLGGALYRNGQTSTTGLSFVMDKRNNRINATRGVYLSATTSLSGGFRVNDDKVLSLFGGDFNFVEAKMNLRAYRPVVPKGEWLIFKYNGTLGSIWSTDGTVIPYIHRYRAGGINSVRGYDWYRLGPSIRASGYRNGQSSFAGSEDPQGADDKLIVGGTETWINNFELEMPIVRQAGISTVLFFDAGNAFGDPWGEGHINPLNLRAAYGAGIRWFSPMGPLRFEYGIPIDPREDERRSVFDFSIGSLF
ncbi:MAG: outer membrane protein assembly factor BamA [Alphaproteobacteria bacterium]|nr:outer membrane protein assembly factor BamA [Alphaproteobacteria bacterium]